MVRTSLILALLAGPALAQPAAPSLQSLVSNSPFGVATVGGPGGPAAAGSLEFRGTFVDRNERFFSLVDPSTRKAEWVGLNEAGRPFLVKSYDAERETISVEFQGRTLDLKLHSARVVALAPMPVAPAPQPGAPNAANAGAQARPAVAAGTSEAQRLAQVAEEIRRRRALRQQATQNAPVQIPGAQPPPPVRPQ